MTTRWMKFGRRFVLDALETRLAPAVFSVTNNSDGVVTGPGQLLGSLRQAIFDANNDTNPDADVINIGAIASPILMTSGSYKITASNLSINGPGSTLLTLNAGNASRVFEIKDSPFEGTHIQCAISGLSIAAGKVTGAASGGGILMSDEFVTLTDVAITNCSSTNGGGGIFAQGVGAKLTLNNCTISGNSTADPSLALYPSGGGVYFYGSTLSVSNSTITMNTASGGHSPDTAQASGGGVSFAGDSINATASISNCSITNNTAGRGGGLFSFNVLGVGSGMNVSLLNCTITGNKAMGNANGSAGGAGAYLYHVGKLAMSLCVITGNQILGKSDGSDYAQGAGMRLNLETGGDATPGKFGVNISASTISNNISSGGGGGVAIAQTSPSVNAPILISGCVVDSNQANGKSKGILGGGLSFALHGIKATVQDCQITNNSAFFGGGGIQVQGDATFPNSLTVRNCTIAYNTTGDVGNGRGAGIGAFNFGSDGNTLIVLNSTIAFNKAAGSSALSPPASGGIYTSPGTAPNGPTVKLESTILYSNTNSGGTGKADFYGPSKGADFLYSLISVTNSPAAIVFSSDVDNIKGTSGSPANPNLDSTLAFNGATMTKTLALLSPSPCIDEGSNPSPIVTLDQRGPGFARMAKFGTDMGAFEVQSIVPPPQVNTIVINDGDPQRSLVKTIKVTFSEPVSFPAGVVAAFDVSRIDKGTLGSVALDVSHAGDSVTITFKSGGTVGIDPGNSLQDGKYLLTIVADKIHGADGLLDGNKNGIYEGPSIDNKTMNFHRLFADGNGDGAVQSDDFAAFRMFFGLGGSLFDFDNNLNTGAEDFAAFRIRFGLSGYL